MSKKPRKFSYNDGNVIFEFIYPQKHEAPWLRLIVTNTPENIAYVKDNFNYTIGNPDVLSNTNEEKLLINEINNYRVILKIIDAMLNINNNEKLLFIRMQCQRKWFEMQWQMDNLRPVLSTLDRMNKLVKKNQDKEVADLKDAFDVIEREISNKPVGISYADSLILQNQILDHVFESDIDYKLKYQICPQLLAFEKNRREFITRFEKLDARSPDPVQKKAEENENPEENKNAEENENAEENIKQETTLADVKNKIRPEIIALRNGNLKPSAAKQHMYNVTKICSDRANKKLIRRYSYFYEFTAFLYKMLKLLKLDSDSLQGKGRRFLFYVARVDKENVDRIFAPRQRLKR